MAWTGANMGGGINGQGYYVDGMINNSRGSEILAYEGTGAK